VKNDIFYHKLRITTFNRRLGRNRVRFVIVQRGVMLNVRIVI